MDHKMTVKHVDDCVCDEKGRDPDCYRLAKIPEPTAKELLAKDRQKEQQCLICPPNRGENASRKPRHESKPKRKNKR